MIQPGLETAALRYLWEEQVRLRILGSSWTRSFDTPSEITQKNAT